MADRNPVTGRERQTKIFLDGVAGRRPVVPVDPDRLAAAAREVMSEVAWAYIAGGAGSERTMRSNRQAFDRFRIVPRMLAGVEERQVGVELFGRRLETPLLLAPVGVLEMVDEEADRAVARAAAARGVPMIFSNQASVAMEACAAAMDEVSSGAPRFFQLYWSTSDELVASFLERAEACGCDAIVLTLDTTLLGWRPQDLDLASLPFFEGRGIAQYTSDPVFLKSLDEPLTETSDDVPKPALTPATLKTAALQMARFPGSLSDKLSGRAKAAVQRFLATYSRPSLSWENLAWLRENTSLPIVLKGILHADDARRALDHGVDGLYVSNHGGRQVDGSIGALDALPGIVEAVGDALPVIFDSGVRSGGDVAKALALGATAVGVGRPFVYGLALAGERGVGAVLDDILAELDLTLALSGCSSIGELRREGLAPAPARAS